MSSPDPNRWRALAVLGVAYLMVVLDVSIVNVALPTIQRELHFSTSGLEWVVSGYALTFGGFLLLGGRSGDLLGRRRVFMAGLVLFAFFSLLCGLATSPAMLIATRALQGVAAAVLAPSVFSIASVTFEEGSDRNKALGILGAIAGSGAAIGLLLGGVLTEFVGWEWIFFVNVPIGLAVLLLVPRVVRESRAPELARHFDVAGAVTVTGGLMLLVYGLTRAPTIGWSSAETIGAFVGSAVLIAIALMIERRSRSPLVDLRIFRRRTLTGANVIGLMLGTVLFGMFFLLTLYQQDVLGFSPLRTGVGNLAIALTVIAASTVAQALVTRIGVKPVLMVGLALIGAGLAYYTQIPVDGSYFANLFPGFLLTGVGLGFSFVPVSIAALSGVSSREAGLASGLITTSQQIGGGLGLAILSTVSTTRTNNLLADGVAAPTALTDGFRLAFSVGVGLAVLAVVTTFVLLRPRDLTTEAPSAESSSRGLRPATSRVSMAPGHIRLAGDPVVQAESLTKRFGGVLAVDDLSFDLQQGSITGFLGPNGAGKTTTLRMLLGLATPTNGRALVFGRPYGELAEASRRVGAVLEATDFHPGRSGRDHLRMLAEAVDIPRSRVEEVLRLVELQDAARRRVKTYSLGMRQRLGLAAALLGDPELLILDEPANGLDPGGVRWLRDFLHSFAAEDRTVLISSHVLAEVAQTVDEVLIINHGKLVVESSLDELTHHTAASVRIRTPARTSLADALSHAGIQFNAGEGETVVAYGTTSERVGDIAFAANVPIHELVGEGSSLEEIFLGLTTEQAA